MDCLHALKTRAKLQVLVFDGAGCFVVGGSDLRAGGGGLGRGVKVREEFAARLDDDAKAGGGGDGGGSGHGASGASLMVMAVRAALEVVWQRKWHWRWWWQ